MKFLPIKFTFDLKMKFTSKNILLLFSLISICLAAPSDEKWNNLIKRDIPIASKESLGYSYDTDAIRIKYKVFCSEKCNVYLMNEHEYENYKNSKPFKFIKADMNTLESQNEFSDTDILPEKIYVVIANQNETDIKASVYLQQFFERDFFNQMIFLVVLQSCFICCVVLTGFACLFGALSTIRDRVIIREIKRSNPIYPSAH